jgi:Skp family chaperone for outer membrane proteins
MYCCRNLALILPLLITIACQDKEQKTEYRYIDYPGILTASPACRADLETLCEEVQTQIDAKEEEVKTLSDAGDAVAWYQAQLDLNELLEIRGTYAKGSTDMVAIRERYQALRQILVANAGDIKGMSAISYQKEELLAVREVFDALGELTIDPAAIAESAAVKPKTVSYSAQVNGMPWAAYWYPKRSRFMYEAGDAPLRKLDSWLANQGIDSRIVGWEEDNFDGAAAEWEGLCDAWAMASVMTLEPKKDVIIDGINFTPSDLKALTIKYFEGYKPKVYGRRYQGLAATDGLIQDLRPEAFHRLVEEYIGKRKQPIIIDEDPGPEIWSKPVFRVAINIMKDPKKPQALLVKAYPWMTRQRAVVDNSPSSLAVDLVAPTYEYRLYYDADTAADGRLKIIAGEWLSASLNFHPDMVFLPQGKDNKEQINPEFRKHNADIRKLLDETGMFKL